MPVVDLDVMWYSAKLPLKQCSLKELAGTHISKEQLDNYYQEAQLALDDETVQYTGSRKGWYLQQFHSRGTATDRIAAAAVKLCDTDFMYYLDCFNALFDTAKNDSHHYDSAIKALGAIWPKLLPARPLKRFAAQYFATLPNDPAGRKRVLIYWYLEDTLKRTYDQFLVLAEASLKDKLVNRREIWLEVCGKLLTSVAESRHIVIALLVQKLGDPLSKIAHQAYHLLLGMLRETSTSQSALLAELEKLSFTKNCPLRVQRYCINVMNQLVFNRDERKLATRAVQLYLAMLRHHAAGSTIDQSVTNAILVGVRRAFPYAGCDFSALDEHVDSLFILVNAGTNFLQRVSAMTLVHLLVTKGYHTLEDRFYRALYRMLLVPPKQLPQSGHLTGFFATLYKAMRSDKLISRVASFTHRLLQRCMFHNEAFICASLLLISEISRVHPTVRQMLCGSCPVEGTVNSKDGYDPRARDPQYSRGNTQSLWVLDALTRHTHPSVVKLAVLILTGQPVSFDLHPLDDFTLPNFLEMFVDVSKEDAATLDAQRNKLESSSQGVPVFQRAIHAAYIPKLSDPNFVNAGPDQVDVSALFLHRYAVQRERFMTSGDLPTRWAKQSVDAEREEEAIKTRIIDTNQSALFGPGKKNKNVVQYVGEGNDSSSSEDASEDDDEIDWGQVDEDGEDEEDDDENMFQRATQQIQNSKSRLGQKRSIAEQEDEDLSDWDEEGQFSSEAQNFSPTAMEFEDMMKAHEPTKKKKRVEQWGDNRGRNSGTPGRRDSRGF